MTNICRHVNDFRVWLGVALNPMFPNSRTLSSPGASLTVKAREAYRASFHGKEPLFRALTTVSPGSHWLLGCFC